MLIFINDFVVVKVNNMDIGNYSSNRVRLFVGTPMILVFILAAGLYFTFQERPVFQIQIAGHAMKTVVKRLSKVRRKVTEPFTPIRTLEVPSVHKQRQGI